MGQGQLRAFYTRSSKRDTTANQGNVLEEFRIHKNIPWEEIRTYSDIGSGKSASRSGLESMIVDIQNGLMKEVVVRDLSRVFRDWEQFGKFLKLLDKYQVKFTSLRENIDTSSAMGRALMAVVAILAQLEREVLIERTLDGIERARREGKVLGRPKGKLDKKDKFGRSTRRKAGYYLRYKNKHKSLLD